MVHGGLCLAHADGATLMVDGAIPGETGRGGAHLPQGADLVLPGRRRRARPPRTGSVAPCPYVDECGGCQLQHVGLPAPARAQAGDPARRPAPGRGRGARAAAPWHGRPLALPLARRVPRHPRRAGAGRRHPRLQPGAELAQGGGRRLPHPPPRASPARCPGFGSWSGGAGRPASASSTSPPASPATSCCSAPSRPPPWPGRWSTRWRRRCPSRGAVEHRPHHPALAGAGLPGVAGVRSSR